jgi:hypothetical protein
VRFIRLNFSPENYCPQQLNITIQHMGRRKCLEYWWSPGDFCGCQVKFQSNGTLESPEINRQDREMWFWADLGQHTFRMHRIDDYSFSQMEEAVTSFKPHQAERHIMTYNRADYVFDDVRDIEPVDRLVACKKLTVKN